ncbi:hypothetical protein CYLTODRAFT_490028 [Cylindrobasidium torrendii FP15055 ss-10]|uniref:Uncharacterized protein n=1 Tax=Cylindrobasidium torrendii FP15055 ss-10 TaxID=1314674 RepID=A0A0D7BD79_9AGAR|nr:hypothetical protein CYLTODRAFT_490028 [Cylindrobasidium torrendii FP15055 ss-10]
MRLGIALYWIEDDPEHPMPYFDWALVVKQKGEWDNEPATVYQIRGGTPDEPSGYRRYFTTKRLLNDTSFSGVVDLGVLDADGAALAELTDKIVREHPADRDAPVNAAHKSIVGPRGWTCARWILVLLMDLEEVGIFEMPLEVNWQTIYVSIIERGLVLRDLWGHNGLETYPILRLGAL